MDDAWVIQEAIPVVGLAASLEERHIRVHPFRAWPSVRRDQAKRDAVLVPKLAPIVVETFELNEDAVRFGELCEHAHQLINVADELLYGTIGERKLLLRVQLLPDRLRRATRPHEPFEEATNIGTDARRHTASCTLPSLTTLARPAGWSTKTILSVAIADGGGAVTASSLASTSRATSSSHAGSVSAARLSLTIALHNEPGEPGDVVLLLQHLDVRVSVREGLETGHRREVLLERGLSMVARTKDDREVQSFFRQHLDECHQLRRELPARGAPVRRKVECDERRARHRRRERDTSLAIHVDQRRAQERRREC
eukprot:5575696-Prymnesium_polylepis.1